MLLIFGILLYKFGSINIQYCEICKLIIKDLELEVLLIST